jgi:hypothetical protein
MFVSSEVFDNLWAEHDHDDAKTKIRDDLMDISNLVGKAYLRLSKTKYWVSEDLDDISARLEEIMYDLSTNEVFDD